MFFFDGFHFASVRQGVAHELSVWGATLAFTPQTHPLNGAALPGIGWELDGQRRL